ncbi:MAG: hypothetical protein ACYCS8_05730, partial [Acidithiobacillus sp.]
VFSVDDRRDMACAAVYSWMEERPQATEFIAGRAEAERRAAMKKLAGPSPSAGPAPTPVSEENEIASHIDAGGENQGKHESAAQDALRPDVQPSSPAAPTPPPAADLDDDPLAAMERQMASTPVEAPASVVEDVSEAEIVGADADVDGSPAGTGNAPPPPETESLPAYTDRTQMAASAFSGLSQFVEEAVACSEKPLENIVKASSEKTSEPEKTAEAREAVQVTKSHMLNVLTDPPYPSPPTPEPMETSKFRSMAERWIKQVKDQ